MASRYCRVVLSLQRQKEGICTLMAIQLSNHHRIMICYPSLEIPFRVNGSHAIRGCVRRRYFGDLSISVCSFIEKAAEKHRPGRICNTLSQAMVLHHPLDVQILDGNHAIFIDYFAALLMSEIMPLVRYSLD